jgi:competence protein ComEC
MPGRLHRPALAGVWPDLPSFRRALAAEAEARRLFPWLAAAFAGGVLLYFAADREPSIIAAWMAAIIGVVACVLARRHPLALGISAALAMAAGGFLAGGLRTAHVAAPVLERATMARVTARVEWVAHRREGARLGLAVSAIEGLPAERTPRRVRVTTRARPGVAAGDRIVALMRLQPPPGSARPGGYDFARDAFFQRIGAVGSVPGAIELTAGGKPGLAGAVAAAVDRARNALTERVAGVIGGEAGAVAAALITGKRDLIPEETNAALRGAGIYHVVSISGLHMALAGGMFFWLARALLALVPALALHRPIKKWAALAAILGSVAYWIFAGMEVATTRALVMVLVMFVAILADRPAMTLRNLAIAAILVLAVTPEAVLGPSFQMSFAAVAALVAMHGRLDALFQELRGMASGPVSRLAAKLAIAALALIGTTLAAGLATAPFSAYHFHTLNPYGLVGNALALPVVSLVVMPSAVLGVIAYPFGLDAPVWWLMGFGVDLMNRAGHLVASIEGASRLVPAFGAPALLLLAGALFAATLPREPVLVAMALPLGGLGLWAAQPPPPPDILVERSGRAVAVRGEDGRLAIIGRAPDFTARQWLHAEADTRSPAHAQAGRCDRWGCAAHLRPHGPIAVVTRSEAFEEDCARAAILVTPLAAPPYCRPPLLFDRDHLRRTGAVALDRDGPGFRSRIAHDPTYRRPWTREIPATPHQAERRAVPASAPARTATGAPPGESARSHEDDAAAQDLRQ